MSPRVSTRFRDDPALPKHSIRFNLGTNCRSAHTAAKSYRLTMASLQPDDKRQPNCVCSTINKGKKQTEREDRVTVIIEHDLTEHILCILDSKEQHECNLNLMIQSGEQVAFRVIGKTPVHLMGVYFDAH